MVITGLYDSALTNPVVGTKNHFFLDQNRVNISIITHLNKRINFFGYEP